MPLWLEHALVILFALSCALVLLVRRVRVLRAKASACSACAYAQVCEGRGEVPALGECSQELGEAPPLKRRLVVLNAQVGSMR